MGSFSNMCIVNLQMFKLVLEKTEEPDINLPTSDGLSKKQESSRKTSISALLTMSKPLTVWITINCGKFWKRQYTILKREKKFFFLVIKTSRTHSPKNLHTKHIAVYEWHHWLNGHEFEQNPGDTEGQGSLVCHSPWGHRVRHDWTTKKILHLWCSFILQLEFVPLDTLHPILPPTSGKHNSFFLGCIISLFFIKNK